MKLKWRELRKICEPKNIQKNSQVNIPIDMVGQERANEALNYLFSCPTTFHGIIVTDRLKGDTVKAYLENKIAERKQGGESFTLKDLCYIYNFADPLSPALLDLPAGEGKIFKTMVGQIKEKLLVKIPVFLSGEKFKKFGNEIYKETKAEADKKINAFWKKITGEGIVKKCRDAGRLLVRIDDDLHYGYNAIPLGKDGKPLEAEAFKNLPAQEQAEHAVNWQKLSKEIAVINNFYIKLLQWVNEAYNDGMEILKNAAYKSMVENIFYKAARRYANHQKIKDFLNELQNYAVVNKELFLPPSSRQAMAMTPQGLMPIKISPEQMMAGQIMMADQENKSKIVPFEVNLLVDNAGLKEPPIIVENTPTYPGLFGKIERKLLFGPALIDEKTDHTMLEPGSFHKARGGFIIISLNDVLYPILKMPILLGLKRVLQENKLEIRDSHEEVGFAHEGKGQHPEAAPLELKVILTVNPLYYYSLWGDIFGKELMENFTVKAEFDDEVDLNASSLQAYCAWIRKYAKEKNFIPFAKTAQAKIIEYLLRENENQEKLLWHIEKLKTIIKESHYYAAEERSVLVQGRHVTKALEGRNHRSNLHEEKIKNAIKSGRILINVSGARIGEINGAGVYELDDYGFGAPTRITVTTHQGNKGLINIEREAKVSDHTHSMGIETLNGFFHEKYGRNKALSFEGRVRFEQGYGVAGPSASMAELIALISSISGKPIRQGIAITGTVDQHGGYGIIGGVNQKIEGFYDICKSGGLTGEQGFVIPKTNANNLMLKEEVVEAVRKGKFHIYAEEDVEGCVKILIGNPEEVNEAVKKQLKLWSKKEKK